MDDVLDIEKMERGILEISEHWEKLEIFIGNMCLLEEDYSRTDFDTDRVELHTQNEALVVQQNNEVAATHSVEGLREGLRERFDQFKNAVQARLSQTAYWAELPGKPQASAGDRGTAQAAGGCG